MKYSLATRLLLLVLLGSFCAQMPIQAAEINDHLLSGSKFAKEKKYKEAVREFETAIKLDPNNANANLLLGLTLVNSGQMERALPYVTAATHLGPSYAGFYNLGLIHSNLGNFQKAVDAYEQAVTLDPNSYQAWHQLGKVYGSNLQFEKAVEAYQKAIALNPKSAQSYQGLGSAYYWNENLPEALAQVEKLKELNMLSMANDLERWIKDKETKKKKAAAKAAAKRQQNPAPPAG